MKKSILYFGLAFIVSFSILGINKTGAQMMGGYGPMMDWAYPQSSSTASASDTRAIAAGETLYDELQTEKISCSGLTREDFENLGEYFMDRMAGTRHATMDSAMSTMMGESGDRTMHIAMGERFSGCNANAVFPAEESTSGNNNNNYYGYIPMMGYGPMIGYGGGWLGWLIMILFWVLVVIGIVAFVRWLKHGHCRMKCGHEHQSSATDILKERYAKGEIDKKEFEEKKKDLESKKMHTDAVFDKIENGGRLAPPPAPNSTNPASGLLNVY